VVRLGELNVLNNSLEGPGGRCDTWLSDKYNLRGCLSGTTGPFRRPTLCHCAYRCQLTTRTQKAGESLQDFATAIELLAHHAYPTLPEDHRGREAGKTFTYGVEDPDIKI
jgi:hypothetical protein